MPGQHTLRAGDTLQLTVEKMIYGGSGLARHEGRVCFVSGALPGETVSVRVTGLKKDFIVAETFETLDPSPHRITPLCPLFGTCGGCHWQYIGYRHQLYWKAAVIRDCLERIASIRDADVCMPIACSSEYNYRTRAIMKVSGRRSPVIGFYKNKSRTVVPVRSCPVLSTKMNTALAFVWEQAEYEPRFLQNAQDIHMLSLYSSGRVIISLKDGARTLGSCVTDTLTDTFSDNAGDVHDSLLGVTFRRDTESFYQTNNLQNIELIKTVIALCEPQRGRNIVDFYCGCGNFSLFLAGQGSRVTGIESNRYAVREARYNAKLNGISRAAFIRSDAGHIHAGDFRKSTHAVLMNPPRGGCSQKALSNAVALHPEIIVYVSCNPATLARDLRKLLESGYEIDRIQPVDMFPQTYHIETVVRLKK